MTDEYDLECDLECEICKIFSSPSRLKILINLDKKSLNVNEIVKKTNLPQPVVSQHLSMMKLRKILKTEKQGSFVHYKIKYPEILNVLNMMKKIRRKIKNENNGD